MNILLFFVVVWASWRVGFIMTIIHIQYVKRDATWEDVVFNILWTAVCVWLFYQVK